MIELCKIKTDNVYARKLLETNKLFLESIKDYIEAEILVGSLAWGRNNAVGANSDIDLVIVYSAEKQDRLLSSKYLKDSFTLEDVNYILGNKMADYLVAKISINGVEFSIDLIKEEFFSYMCTYDLVSVSRGVDSWKFGRYKQDNTYISKSFLGKTNPVTKISVQTLSGYRIQLPLFFINRETQDAPSEYFYGMPTIKLLTSVPLYNSEHYDVRLLLNKLQDNIISRMRAESMECKDCGSQYNILNLFVFRDRMDSDIQRMFDIS
ncbi:MAG: hypothetical protein J5517_06600 [Eubacterium sp.]|nr:hypothetical protein [Eubacterium sp.]